MRGFRLILSVFLASQLKAEPIPGEYIVKFKNNLALSLNQKAYSYKNYVNHMGKNLKLSHRQEIYWLKNKDLTLSELQKMPEIEKVELNYRIEAFFGSRKPKKVKPNGYPSFVPVPHTSNPSPDEASVPIPEPDYDVLMANDQHFSKQWALRNTQGFDAKVAKAWKYTVGSENTIIAVVDTGIDYNHNDLDANMWASTQNGQVIHGINAINDTLDPMDDNNHGTHVAGVIGALANNNRGIAGINWKVQLMAAKFMDSKGAGSVANAIKAIDWARENGAEIMNMSWGGADNSQLLLEALGRAEAAGISLVAAAGNSSNNNDLNGIYPSGYNIPSLISVAASDGGDKIAWFSNFGATSVDLMAPGVSIVSTIRSNSYAMMDGTSMAAPQVSGALGLLKSRFPNMSPLELKQKLLSSVDFVPSAKSKVLSAGRLNVYKALQ